MEKSIMNIIKQFSVKSVGGSEKKDIIEEKMKMEKTEDFKKQYYTIRARLDNHNSRSFNKDKFVENIESEYFQQNISNSFKNLCGVIGGGYAIIDKPHDKIFFLQNKYLKKERNQDIPFYRLPYQIDLHFNLLKISSYDDLKTKELVSWLLDTMFESYYDNMSIDHDDQDERKAPDFLKNMPPLESTYSFEPLPYERDLREKNEIDALYCYTGEVLFFLYAWRLLMRNAKQKGFHAQMDLTTSLNEEIISKPVFNNIWEYDKWNEIFKYIPEKKWLNKLKENKKWWNTQKADAVGIPTFEEIEKTWNTVVKFIDAKGQVSNNFVEAEWPLLGLSETDSHCEMATIALKSYMRHLLRYVTFPVHVLKPPQYFPPSLSSVQDINTAIDYTLAQKDEKIKEDFITQLFDRNEPPEYWHYVFRKIIYNSLSYDLKKPVEEWTIRGMFKSLHCKTRFPIIPLFFQIALSKDRAPREFLVCPIAKSFSNAFELQFSTRIRNSEFKNASKLFSKIAFSILTIKPVQILDNAFFLTEQNSYFSDDRNAVISEIARLRLRCMQDFMTVISEPTVDKAFYDKIIKRETIDDTRHQQYFAQAHEIHKLVRFIHPETPEFALHEIRKYFVAIFGSVNYVLEELGTPTLSNEFNFGNTLSELIMNAFTYARHIEILSNFARDGEVPDSKELYEEKIRQKNINTQLIFDAFPTVKLPLEDYTKKVNLLYFFMALTAAFRNINKHHLDKSSIRIYIYEKDNLRIINKYQENNLFQGLIDHPGSTGKTLEYFLGKYAPGKASRSARLSDKDKQSWETILPIPNFLIKET